MGNDVLKGCKINIDRGYMLYNLAKKGLLYYLIFYGPHRRINMHQNN